MPEVFFSFLSLFFFFKKKASVTPSFFREHPCPLKPVVLFRDVMDTKSPPLKT